MILSFNQLKKRDVVNVADGRNFGSITDLSLDFPKGVLTGVYVLARKRKWFLKFFDKNTLFIPEKNIIKIGGDVILVDLRCGETCETSVNLNKPHPPAPPKPPHPVPPCPPPCSPCPPPCEPFSPSPCEQGLSDVSDRIDLSDY